MNRSLKFRVWDKANNKFIDPFRFEWNDYYKTTGMVLLDLNGKIRIADYSSGNGDNSASSVYSEVDNPDNYIVQEYTGCHDSSNKEIYEGDIVKDTWRENRPYSYSPDEEYDCETIFEVKYNDCSFNLERKYSGEQTCVDRFHREVIGNIFENPELLK